jgi:hypothetical protein
MKISFEAYDGQTFDSPEKCFLHELSTEIAKDEDFQNATASLQSFVTHFRKEEFLRELASVLPQLVVIRNKAKDRALANITGLDELLRQTQVATASISSMSKIVNDKEL